MLVQAGVLFEEVPGISSAIAAPAYAGIPVTHRDFASTVTFVTGHEDPTKADSAIDWKHLAGLRGTKIFLMGMERLREITERLMQEGAAPHTSVAIVRWGTTPHQESLEGTLATMADLAEGSGFAPPAIVVVGEVVKLRHQLNWFEALPLFGQRVVVTRTRAQASDLTRRLTRLGADVLEIPTIKIVPIDLGKPEFLRMRDISQFYHWLVFTSPNAVELFFESFLKINRDIRALGSIRLAVVGPATRRKLEQLHLTAEIQPEIFTTEVLARCFVSEEIKGRRFCLPQGKLAQDLLSNHLRKHGGVVDEWIIYDTLPVKMDHEGASIRYEKEGAHWITFTSSSTAENWHALHLKPAAECPQPKVISMGPVTTETLKKLGYEVVAQSPEATLDSLVETLCQSRLR
jgi:uroporphyrinogen III methyltransferase/synthase